MPKNLGAITDPKDIATKEYVDTKYVKPSGGIPKTDLAADVQTSLGKADTALQTAPVSSVNGQTGAVTIDVPVAYTGNPAMDGTASAGSSADYARGDHRHPHDSTIPAYASIDANGLITYKHTANGTALFTLQLPIYSGGVS